VQKALASLPWVRQVQVNYSQKQAVVVAEADKVDEPALVKALQQAGYGGRVVK
jgi:hypothetical protein